MTALRFAAKTANRLLSATLQARLLPPFFEAFEPVSRFEDAQLRQGPKVTAAQAACESRPDAR